MESTNREKKKNQRTKKMLEGSFAMQTQLHRMEFSILSHCFIIWNFCSSIGLRESKFYHCLPFCCHSCPVNYRIGNRKMMIKKVVAFSEKIVSHHYYCLPFDLTFFHPLFKLNNWFLFYFQFDFIWNYIARMTTKTLWWAK